MAVVELFSGLACLEMSGGFGRLPGLRAGVGCAGSQVGIWGPRGCVG